MSFLKDMASQAVSKVTGGAADQSSGLAGGIAEMLSGQTGGLSGLMQSFHDKGLGSVVTSWIGSGENLPISADQIKSALGSDRLQQLAAKAGISTDEASSKLAEILPSMVDKLTPDGKIPEAGDLAQKARNFLSAKG